MEARSWSRLAVAGLALAGAGLLGVFLAGSGYHPGRSSLRAALALPIPAARAFGLVHRTAAGMPAWEITAVDSTAGRIEATATTRWFGFKDDIVIRVTPRGADSAVVDMRSKSRVGKSDVGANASRIRTYLAALARAAGGSP